ncbi:MAG TPA: class I SAM-dependent methyltransferase [Pyrinomonadaceae bacterium]|nr:class I SAM-dependent methyltransferase [Pyrinomonadaceae bacterium]
MQSALAAAAVAGSLMPSAAERRPVTPKAALGSVEELTSGPYRSFMAHVNALAADNKLNLYHDNWSKVWEYPWIWFNSLCDLDLQDMKILDIGSGKSPMPWLFALLGAEVMMVETGRENVRLWSRIQRRHQLKIGWRIVSDEELPFADNTFDAVTSFSVIEHQPDKAAAVAEAARVLKPGGVFGVSFDLCQQEWDMRYPAGLGTALSIEEFEEFVWKHPAFDNGGQTLDWKIEQCADFLQWHWGGDSNSKYIVGAAILKKTGTRDR